MSRLSLVGALGASLMVTTPALANISPIGEISSPEEKQFNYSHETTQQVKNILWSICTQDETIKDDGIMQYNPNTNLVEKCDAENMYSENSYPLGKIPLEFGPCGVSGNGEDLCELRGENFLDSCIIHDPFKKRLDLSPKSCSEVYKQIQEYIREKILRGTK